MHTNTSKRMSLYFWLFKASFFIVLLALSNLSYAESMYRNTDRSESPTIKEYEEFGKHFATALNKKDMRVLSELFDMSEFARITARTVVDSQKDIDAFAKGFLKNPKDKLLNQMFTPVFNQDAAAKYLRVLKNNRPLIRIDYKSNGHEYVILRVERVANNQLAVVDLFTLTSGKDMSASVGALSQLIVKPSTSMLKRLFGRADIDSKMLSTLKEVGKLRNSGKYKDAYNLVETLPEDVKYSRAIIDVSIFLAQNINDDEYRKQLSKLEKYYGNDDTTMFILVDHYFFMHEYTKMLAALDRLIVMLGEDGALLNLKASAYISAKDFKNAKKYCKMAIQVEPQYDGAYWTLVTALTMHEEYGELIKALGMLEKQFGYSFTAKTFTGNEFYSKFVQSSEFKGKYKYPIN